MSSTPEPSLDFDTAVKGGGVVAVVATLLSLIVHALVVPPVLRHMSHSVVAMQPNKKRIEVVLQPRVIAKKKAKVPKPKGVHLKHRHTQSIPRPTPPRAVPLPGTFFTSVRKAQPVPTRPLPVEYTPPEPVEPPEGEKEAVAKLTPTPTPAPPLVVVPPVAIAPVQIKGPTRDPEAFFAPRPRIPQDELRRKGENDVRVRFIIAPDGSAQVSLVTSCGVPELDQSALAACRSWRWKPALRQGTAYTRVINERIEFVVI